LLVISHFFAFNREKGCPELYADVEREKSVGCERENLVRDRDRQALEDQLETHGKRSHYGEEKNEHVPDEFDLAHIVDDGNAALLDRLLLLVSLSTLFLSHKRALDIEVHFPDDLLSAPGPEMGVDRI